MKPIAIYKCINGHYSTSSDKCKHCNGNIVDVVEARYGDCIVCGQLCPVEVYCCDIPKKKSENDFLIE